MTQSWEELFYTSGVKLEMLKSCMYIIVWTHNNDGTQKLLPTNNNHNILAPYS